MRLDLTDVGLQDRLKLLAARSQHIRGRCASGMPMAAVVHKFLTEMADDLGDAEKIKARNEFLERAQKDPLVMSELRAIRVEQYNNYVYANMNIAGLFFEQVELAPDERPVHQNETTQQVRVRYVGQDGQPTEQKIVKPQTELLIDLHFLSTDEVDYQVLDVYRGTVVDAALATIRLAYDMARKRDGLCKTLLDTQLGAFTFTGARQNWSYLPHTDVVVANLPTTNILSVANSNLTDKNSTNKFRFEVFKAAERYGGQWGGAFIDGPLVPTGKILVPSLDPSDIADEIVPSGSTNNAVADSLLTNGWISIPYLRNWTLIPDNTLTPGSCYVQYNRVPGRTYTKPSMDEEVVDNGMINKKKNRESRFMRSVFGAAVNSYSRAFFAQVKYKA